MSANNQLNLLFRRSNRRIAIETENHIHSIGDTPILEHIILQPSVVIHQNDYLYMIYLLVLILFYIYYLTIYLQGNNDQQEFDYFDNYEREIPRLLWFKKGYRVD